VIDERDLERAGEVVEAELESVIARHRAQVDASAGRPECECGETISPLRQSLGASRCVECQERHEQRRRAWR
jgi:RNA polymerase-binding transcription factor DksA